MRLRHIVMLIAGVLALSSSAIFVKVIDEPVEVIAFYRMLISALVMGCILLVTKSYRMELLRLSMKRLLIMVVSGIILAIHYLLWFDSLNYTSVASSTVIVTLQPIFAVIGGFYLFKERYSLKALSGIVVAVAGCIFIGYSDLQISGIALYGDFLALIAAMVITLYFFVGQKVRIHTSLVVYSCISYSSSALFLLAINFARGNHLTGFPADTWFALIGLALFATIMGQSLFNFLIKWLSTTVISMSILGEVIGTCILGYIFLNEHITLTQCIGIAIILSGQLLFIIGSRK